VDVLSRNAVRIQEDRLRDVAGQLIMPSVPHLGQSASHNGRAPATFPDFLPRN
jgi:hypothetical protein